MKIKDKFRAPFGAVPLLRLANVNRWGIISMDKQQSVAEHSFNVAAILSYFASVMGLVRLHRLELLSDGLTHDLNEAYTGDIPTPAKEKLLAGGTDGWTKNLVKLADSIEAYRFAKLHCNDTPEVKKWLMDNLTNSINNYLGKTDLVYEDIRPLLDEVR